MTNSQNDTYTSPLASRNASPEMLRIWSPRHKFNTWRRIWLAVAEAQHEVTKSWDQPLVSQEQLDELRAVVERGITDEEIARAAELERDLRHDVMAHVHCLGEQCPKAKGIIHLGCTSQDVVCNAELVMMRQALGIIETKTVGAVSALGDFAGEWKDSATLGFTHYQPAQPTTVGRRAAQWGYDLKLVFDELNPEPVLMDGWSSLRLRGMRGATGTQASFLALFDGNSSLVEAFSKRVVWTLDRITVSCRPEQEALTSETVARHWARYAKHHEQKIARLGELGVPEDSEYLAGSKKMLERIRKMTPEQAWDAYLEMQSDDMGTYLLSGQTYPRVVDTIILSRFASVASVLHKIATDIRLLSNRKEIDEPFGAKQIGSSAMPYKRNPMKCERICGLTRFVMNLVGNAYDTAATQWLERTLDDSSNRRLSLPEAFLALDGALDLMHQVASGLVVHEAMVRKNLMAELPFLATENILMEAVKAGGDRQELHEKIRVHAQAAGMKVKQEGLDNDLIERLRQDEAFAPVHHLLTEDQLLDPMKYVGRSVEQTERFLKEVVEPLRERYGDDLEKLGGSDRGV